MALTLENCGRHTHHKEQNLSTAIEGARSLGCNIFNTGPKDFLSGNSPVVLGLVCVPATRCSPL